MPSKTLKISKKYNFGPSNKEVFLGFRPVCGILKMDQGLI